MQEAAARTPTISRDISELINQHKTSSDATLPPVYTAALFVRFCKAFLMKFVIQRVTGASVTVDGEVIGKIGKGFMVLIGISQTDTKEIADKLIRKMTGLRIFDDENGKTNLAPADVGGSLLLISQFTLYADCRKGYRPSFTSAGSPGMANELYEYIVEQCRKCESIADVQTGRFGADMKVELLNDGPFTVILDSNELM